MNASRLSRVLEGMRREGIPQIIVSSPQSVYYLTGLWVNPSERLWALYIRDDGECALFGNVLFALDKPLADMRLFEHTDTDDCVADLAAFVRPGALGIDKFWPSQFLIRLMQKRPDILPVAGSAPVDEARMCKDADEMRRMRHSSLLNDRCTGALIASLAAGQTERQVARRYGELAADTGEAEVAFSLVCFRENAADPHHSASSDTLREGDGVVLDVGLDCGHMQSDMTRTVFLGRASDEQKRIYDIVLRANRAAIASVRPGVPMKTFDLAARRAIEEAGYGEYFIHRTGHGIGMEVHEPPDVSSANERIARPGMVFSIEPGIYLPGNMGVRVEDLVAVTEDGCEVLNHLGKELTIL